MDSKSSGSNGKEDLNGLPASVPLSTWLEPSWAGTNQFYLNFEDAQSVGVSDAFSLLPWLSKPNVSTSSGYGRDSHL